MPLMTLAIRAALLELTNVFPTCRMLVTARLPHIHQHSTVTAQTRLRAAPAAIVIVALGVASRSHRGVICRVAPKAMEVGSVAAIRLIRTMPLAYPSSISAEGDEIEL